MTRGTHSAGDVPRTTLVVVNWNGRRFLDACFTSLRKLEYPRDRLQIIMVDNLSEDDSIARVKKRFPEVEIVRNTRNNYAQANNLGVDASNGEFVGFGRRLLRRERGGRRRADRRGAGR